MKRTASLLLLGAMLLSLAACGKPAAPAETAPTETAPVEETAAPNDAEEHAVSGIVNRLDSYLVLLDDQGNYLVFDFGDDVDQKALTEGDRITVTYTGELGSENPAPVAVAIQKAP